MNIYRLIDGVYRCINDPYDKRTYILVEKEGYYPALVPIQEDKPVDDTTDNGVRGIKRARASPTLIAKQDFTHISKGGEDHK